MTTPKRTVSIPTLGRDYESAKPTLQALIEAVETGQRVRPEVMKSFVRVEDLVALKLLRLSENGKTLVSVQPQFVIPTFINSWVNFETTGLGDEHVHAGYYRDALGRVYLRGLVKSGAVPSTIFVLPAGYRPGSRLLFGTISNSAIGRVDVTAAGLVIAQVGNTAWISLNGISFVAVQ
jgi:hypothetical protein